jgi:hypothetical protein
MRDLCCVDEYAPWLIFGKQIPAAEITIAKPAFPGLSTGEQETLRDERFDLPTRRISQ